MVSAAGPLLAGVRRGAAALRDLDKPPALYVGSFISPVSYITLPNQFWSRERERGNERGVIKCTGKTGLQSTGEKSKSRLEEKSHVCA